MSEYRIEDLAEGLWGPANPLMFELPKVYLQKIILMLFAVVMPLNLIFI